MNYYSPIHWIPISIMGLVAVIINSYMLVHELKKRRSGKAKFASKYLKLWSFLCMLSGVIAGFSVFTLYFPGFCYVTSYIFSLAGPLQPICMGLYQIARLSHCFSDDNAIGYPNYVFTILYTIATLLVIGKISAPWVRGDIVTDCGINIQYYHYVGYMKNGLISDSESPSLISVFLTVYFLWDIVTLLLYTCKIGTFKKLKINTKNIDVYKRMLAVLHRVLIMTLFYEIMVFVILVNTMVMICSNVFDKSDWLFYLTGLIITIIYNYSVYLMLEHNTSEYIKFIKILSYSKLSYLCCCYKYVLNDQLNVSSSSTEALKLQIEVTKNKRTMETDKNDSTNQTTTSDLKRYAKINRKVINAMKENMEDAQRTTSVDLERYAEQLNVSSTEGLKVQIEVTKNKKTMEDTQQSEQRYAEQNRITKKKLKDGTQCRKETMVRI